MSAGPIEPAPHGAAGAETPQARAGEAAAGAAPRAVASEAAAGSSGGALPELPREVRGEIDHWVAKFPPGRQRSALLSALRVVQEHNHGYLSTELMDAVAAHLALPPIQVYEVASFYSMFETHPCGRHHVSVCTNIACFLRGAEQLAAHVEKKLGIRMGQSTPDGRIFLKREEECLAACTGAPMMMVDHVFHEHLTPEKVDQLLDALE
jgi:NADH-quinone oxidoreductase subunit E